MTVQYRLISSMKKVDYLAGTSINEACGRAYNRALHGGSLYFDFNGVRITMRPKSQLDEDLVMVDNDELTEVGGE